MYSLLARFGETTVIKAHEAAVATVLRVLPMLSWKEASAEAVNAVVYATKYYPEWFWKGAQHLRKWRTTHGHLLPEPAHETEKTSHPSPPCGQVLTAT